MKERLDNRTWQEINYLRRVIADHSDHAARYEMVWGIPPHERLQKLLAKVENRAIMGRRGYYD